MHSAPSVHGPWTTIGNIMDAGNTPVVAGTPHEWTNRTVWEDPHLWIDPETGAFHIICHAYPPCDNSAPYHYGDVVAGHGFSQAGAEWKWSATPPYTRYVQSGGKTLKYGTRERPFLLMEGGARERWEHAVLPEYVCSGLRDAAEGKTESNLQPWLMP